MGVVQKLPRDQPINDKSSSCKQSCSDISDHINGYCGRQHGANGCEEITLIKHVHHGAFYVATDLNIFLASNIFSTQLEIVGMKMTGL